MTSERSQWLDNSKGALMLLVIFGHLIEPLARVSGLGGGLFGAIYLFHMPAFALVSGMVSSVALDRASLIGLFQKLFLPLAIFQVLYWPALSLVAPTLVGDLLTPHWILWYLLSLAVWRVVLPLFVRMRYPVLVSVILALAAGLIDTIDLTLSLSRTFVLFPAFLIGHLYKDHIRQVAITRRPVGTVLFLGLVGATFAFFRTGANIELMFNCHPYAVWSLTYLQSALIRLVLIVAGIVTAIAFLSLMPRGKSVLGEFGRKTMQLFLGHGFLVLAVWFAVPADALNAEVPYILLSAILAVVFAVALTRLPPISLIKRRPEPSHG